MLMLEFMMYKGIYDSPLGAITVLSDGNAITYLDFQDAEGEGKENGLIKDARTWLDIYFSGKKPDFSLPLSFSSTPFTERVWNHLLAIPYGKTVTYGEIALKIAEEKGIAKMSSRAVGSAVGRNHILIMIPCHRVIGSNNRLTGFGGGIWRKTRLLELEGIDVSRLR